MACRTLLKRKSQLSLLGSACEQGAAAGVSLRRKSSSIAEVRFVAIERDGVLMTWDGSRGVGADIPGQPVEVRFELDSEHYVFNALSRGCMECELADGTRCRVLKLNLPLRLERDAGRQYLRMSLANLPPINATFTHVVDDRRQFAAELTDIAEGGIGVTARAGDVAKLFTGDLFWVTVELPGERGRTEVVVRLVHVRPVRQSDRLAIGWVFQPADDAVNYERFQRRLQAFVARNQTPADVD